MRMDMVSQYLPLIRSTTLFSIQSLVFLKDHFTPNSVGDIEGSPQREALYNRHEVEKGKKEKRKECKLSPPP